MAMVDKVAEGGWMKRLDGLIGAGASLEDPFGLEELPNLREYLMSRRSAIREGEAILGLSEPELSRWARGLLRTWNLD